MVDTISSIRVRGFKCLDDVELKLSGGLTVLIGDNGVGKSAIVEACEILRRSTGPQSFDDLVAIHGFPFVVRDDGGLARFDIELEATRDGPAVRYGFGIRREGMRAFFESEKMSIFENGHWLPQLRPGPDGSGVVIVGTDDKEHLTQLSPHRLSLASFVGREHEVPNLKRVIDALNAIDVHMPFAVRPTWFARTRKERAPLREPTQLRDASQLDRGGDNLVSAFQELKNRSDWDVTREYVRLGLGDDVEDIRISVDANSYGVLTLKRRALDAPVPMSALSDGTLAYLCFVALVRMRPKRSLLVFDEPELHLHPRLMGRVMDFFISMSADHPVLLSTHSDRILDLLPDPAGSAVLARLDVNDATVLERPNRSVLDAWLKEYRGLGAIRADGHEASVFVDTDLGGTGA